MRGLAATLLACLALCATHGGAAQAQATRSVMDTLGASIRALDTADVEAAERSLNELSPRERQLPEVLFQRGMVDFHLGRYADGTREIEQAIASAPKSPHLAEWRAMLSWVKAARDITKDFVEASSNGGRYVVRYQKGADEVLASYALDALGKADRAIEKHLGIHLPGPIRLEVYPSAKSLASVSSLSLIHI